MFNLSQSFRKVRVSFLKADIMSRTFAKKDKIENDISLTRGKKTNWEIMHGNEDIMMMHIMHHTVLLVQHDDDFTSSTSHNHCFTTCALALSPLVTWLVSAAQAFCIASTFHGVFLFTKLFTKQENRKITLNYDIKVQLYEKLP